MKILEFIKNNKIPIIAILSTLAFWLYFGLQTPSVTQKDLIKHDEELVKLVMHKLNERIESTTQSIHKRDEYIKKLSMSIDSLNLVMQSNRKTLDIQIYNLNKLENELKIGDYNNASDSALLYRLRTRN